MMFVETNLPFATEDGALTICFVTADGAETLLPWHSFSSGHMDIEETAIELQFMESKIRIEGDGLRRLWEQLRAQDVALVRESREKGIGCSLHGRHDYRPSRVLREQQ